MPDEPVFDAAAPVPIRPRRGSGSAAAPAEHLVRELHASLRATDAYVRLLLSRIELACTSDLVRLDDVPGETLVHLVAVSDALQVGIGSALAHVDPGLARTVQLVADLARESAPGGDDRVP